MWQRCKGGEWKLRMDMECDICKKERCRRCCVIRATDESFQQYTAELLATAPYVHPFRHPAYHAQQVRFLPFAKANKRRVMWCTAFDKILDRNNVVSKDQEELRKEQWLKFHERFTNRIPGILPLVLNLPVRFTDSPNKNAKEMGIYKHTRGKLRGWV